MLTKEVFVGLREFPVPMGDNTANEFHSVATLKAYSDEQNGSAKRFEELNAH
jgi:hypothetical protein